MTEQLITDEQVAAAIRRGDRAELITLRGTLVQQKKQIEGQLADDKGQMLEERAGLLEKGLNPREAQMRATASGSNDWRGRAVFAQNRIDGRLAKIKAALTALSATPVEKNVKTGAMEPRPIDVLVLRGSAEEVGEALRTDGRKLSALTVFDGAVIAVMWANS